MARLRAAGCVFAEDEARLLIATARTPDELAAMVERRAAGLPLEQVLGWAEFCGLRIAVDPGVFVPRRRTEFLVQQRRGLARPGAIVVDLCCGAGAIGAALAAAMDRAEVHAADIDPAAVACARRNVPGGHVYQGDLYQPLPARLRGRVADPGRQRAVRAHRRDRVPARPRPGPTSRWSRWTAARTAWTCCAASPPRRPAGWPPAATC